MPFATTDDGVKLYYEECGSGTPVVFVHEFAADLRSWEPQVRYFCRRYRCITFNARGYPPSDVPADVSKYSQARARDDIRAVMDFLDIEQGHVVGLSMGGFATLHFGLTYPQRCRSIVVAGCGYGAKPEDRDEFQRAAEDTARLFDEKGSKGAAEIYGAGAWRIPFQAKDPRGWGEFSDRLGGHDAKGAALTMRGVQKHRPSLWDLRDDMQRMTVPTLLMTGDEDEPCLEPCLMMKRTIPSSALVVLPKTGHAVNLEEPAAFNGALDSFIATVDAGRWMLRDKRTLPGAGLLGAIEDATT
jgi:pimeloyl-ACP methyl ester carboxylesterase